MPTITITTKTEVPVSVLKAEMRVRYWEDATVNGQEDTEGNLIPMRDGEMWTILIDLDEGRVIDWPEGVTADTCYKICDAGSYSLLGPDGELVVKIDSYVPSCLYPNAKGYGDYVMLDIDETGTIKDWCADLSDIQQYL